MKLFKETLPPDSRFPIQMTTATPKKNQLTVKIAALARSSPNVGDFFKDASRLRSMTFENARENIVIKMPALPIHPDNDYLQVRCFLGNTTPQHYVPGMFKLFGRVRVRLNSVSACVTMKISWRTVIVNCQLVINFSTIIQSGVLLFQAADNLTFVAFYSSVISFSFQTFDIGSVVILFAVVTCKACGAYVGQEKARI